MRSRLPLAALASVLSAAILVAFLTLDSTPWPTAARDWAEARGRQDTGAVNLVSAIYLGYRAYDTLGETLVLIVGILGTLGLITAKDLLSPPQRQSLRTEFLSVASGKLGPIVLMFGLYVMLYGHLSPGGGFQGGVVVASGLVFLAIGNRRPLPTALARSSFLSRVEGLAFLGFLLLALAGLLARGGLLSNLAVLLRLPPAASLVVLNVLIGLKVGCGLGLLCLVLLGKKST